MNKNLHIMVIAGEASGDMRAGELVSAIKAINPNIQFSGVGGECMQKAGVELFENITSLAVIGIVEVLKNLGTIKKVFERVLFEAEAELPDAVILVDYPGFNLRLAAELKKRSIKVIYYISPQVWAWREGRIEKIKKIVDRMIVLFPFEKELYARHGMNVDYVGHPLVDEIDLIRDSALFSNEKYTHENRALSLIKGATIIGLLPGSRQKEVERHLPVMLEAAQKLYEEDNRRQFLLLKAPTIKKELLTSYIPANLPVKIFEGISYEGINATSAVIVASGTATLETALLNKPMVVIYKTSWITYAIAKAVIKIPYIGLVNVVAGKKIVPELIQNDCNAKQIAETVNTILKNKTMVEDLKNIKAALGLPGASHRAAQVVLQELI
ncbi:MAG: lipid-A-disaccharide synthase [Candidatus Omnitrophica bacterium]|nr:lipid-A-disaccharide synthase [Candidatus Omnitrophota bacterium]